MNIGIDIDDTITNTYETLIPIIIMKYGMRFDKLLKQNPSYSMLHNVLPDFKSFVLDNYTTMAKMVPLKKGVVDVLNKLKEDGHKIIFISARNNIEYNNPYDISYNYLKANNIPFDKLIVNVKDKAKECILQDIDLFIDDNTKNCKAVKNKGIETLQFGTIFTPRNKYLKRVNTWEEVYNQVQAMFA